MNEDAEKVWEIIQKLNTGERELIFTESGAYEIRRLSQQERPKYECMD